jgi:hypothetical protein
MEAPESLFRTPSLLRTYFVQLIKHSSVSIVAVVLHKESKNATGEKLAEIVIVIVLFVIIVELINVRCNHGLQ